VVAAGAKQAMLLKRHLGHADALFAPDDAVDFLNEVTLGRHLRRALIEEFGNIFPRENVRLSDFQVPRHEQNPLTPR
tara:strand:- start:10 stop:240 length:231 start_codon:yes stop_codon:yes gene_type:complete